MAEEDVVVKLIKIWVCEPCLQGVGEVCCTPSCALCRHRSLEWPIMPEMYEVLEESTDRTLVQDARNEIVTRIRETLGVNPTLTEKSVEHIPDDEKARLEWIAEHEDDG
jgi:hypothetical protein